MQTLRIHFPKARTCLGLIDLQTATEVITIFTLINKVSGFYGILSLFTGNTSLLPPTHTRCADVRITDEYVYMVDRRHRSMSMGVKTNKRCILYLESCVDCRKTPSSWCGMHTSSPSISSSISSTPSFSHQYGPSSSLIQIMRQQ